MEREQVFSWVLLALLLVLVYLSYLLVAPFLTYIVLALVLGYLLHPVYSWFAKGLPHSIAAILVLVLALVLLLVPTVYVTAKLVGQSIDAYNTFSGIVLERGGQLLDQMLSVTGYTAQDAVLGVGRAVRDYVVVAGPAFIGTVAQTILGLFILAFLLYFALTEGEAWVAAAKRLIPMTPKHKEVLFERIGSVTYAVMFGQFLTALIQGALGGLLFFAFGIPNPVFWGFIMVILSFVPMLGTPLVWVPAAIVELLHGNYVAGFGVLILGAAIVMNVDNFLRPRLIGKRARLSTPLVLLGVLGGLQLFGFVGLVLGPLILALLQTTLAFFHEHNVVEKGVAAKRRPRA